MNGVTLPSYASNAYLYGPTLAAAPAAAPAAISPFSVLLAQSPLPQPSAPPQSALDALLNISESGTPAGSPAPPGSALDAGWGLGQFGSFAGNIAGGRLGSTALGALGRGVGNAIAASRAQEIADEFGLGQMTSPASAFGQGLERGALGRAADMFGGLVSNYNARAELADRFNEMVAAQNIDPVMQMEMHRSFTARQDEPMATTHFGAAPAGEKDAPEGGWGDVSAESTSGGVDGGSKGDTSSDFRRGGMVNYAQGGMVLELQGGGKIAVGPGGGLDDLIPTSINGRRAAALSDGEFVVPADVVSMMGDGSSNAGARRLYDLVRQIREAKTGTSRQAGPLPVGEILKRTMR